MDPKQQKAPASTAAPRTVKARVKPGNRYGTAGEGEIVEVDPAELELCAHALESPDAVKAKEEDRAKAEADAAERQRVLDERRAALFAARDAAIAGRRIARERAAARLSASLEAGK